MKSLLLIGRKVEIGPNPFTLGVKPNATKTFFTLKPTSSYIDPTLFIGSTKYGIPNFWLRPDNAHHLKIIILLYTMQVHEAMLKTNFG